MTTTTTKTKLLQKSELGLSLKETRYHKMPNYCGDGKWYENGKNRFISFT
jgi:hypothetical protein